MNDTMENALVIIGCILFIALLSWFEDRYWGNVSRGAVEPEDENVAPQGSSFSKPVVPLISAFLDGLRPFVRWVFAIVGVAVVITAVVAITWLFTIIGTYYLGGAT